MTNLRTQRLRDPVHGLIVFRDDQPVDQLAWTLIGTPEFQRLRRQVDGYDRDAFFGEQL